MNRVESINFGTDPNRNMSLLLSGLDSTQAQIVPEANKYYVFVYKATTPGRYDQHPLILCGGVFNKGFTGYNVHWGQVRQYSFAGVLSNVYELDQEEFETLNNVPLASFK